MVLFPGACQLVSVAEEIKASGSLLLGRVWQAPTGCSTAMLCLKKRSHVLASSLTLHVPASLAWQAGVVKNCSEENQAAEVLRVKFS